MELKITVFKKPATQHYQLLLAADPSKELIDSYLNRSFCYQATAQGQLVGIIILLPTHPETLEIVNIAVDPQIRNQGIGQQLLTFVEKTARNKKFKCLEIGTGSTSFAQLYLYQKRGFRIVGIDQDFFSIHYNKEIIENKLVLKDMLRLKKLL
ncbi:GNAT family N-acetyltransferase [Ligilactobacillus acidipiscis]|uniref:GNAT family N-acetyltransferase n=1 Tax=Ligilactobacillus acidipiscis TaxID=89059 RepID=UPI0022E67BE8|nr:GNAT family N-acetyltransferase [Ligilactobacillus acidipiscis]